jgi:hypothetical protein
LKPAVSTTSVSPSQRPLETPVQEGGMSTGHFCPAVGTQWNHVFCSNSIAMDAGFCTNCTPCGELMLRDMPNGRQLPA